MAKRTNPAHMKEHIISIWLYEAGYFRGDLPKLLRIAPDRVHMVMKNPKAYLTCEQLETISHATERHITEIIRAMFFNGSEATKTPQKWHEETTEQ